ncbi:hypothetical protein C0992_005176 [Termitomyces sp. T32_za158]|nr:hypothetical protein C0992_005176 [Termitomyces sp. T32_za158]
MDDRLFPQFWSDWHSLYHLDDHYPEDPEVKQEPDDPACFIIELESPHATTTPSLAPPTEVPLRATQASSDMRRMMTVFRLNPFAIHNGVGAVPAPLESADPLDTEPITFEFQLDIDPGILDPDPPATASASPPFRTFSPDYDLVDKHTDPWSAYSDIQELSTSPTPPALPPIQSWDVSYPDATDDPFYPPVSPRRDDTFYPHPVSPRRSSRPAYHQKAATAPASIPGDSASTYTSSSSYSHRVTPHPEAVHWHHSALRDVGYHPCTPGASRSPPSNHNPYADVSAPSPILITYLTARQSISLRRWSLPDAHVPAPSHFLV